MKLHCIITNRIYNNYRMKVFVLTIILLSSFVSICQKTYVPDDDFENYLEMFHPATSDGIPNNDSILTTGAATVTLLNIGSPLQDIADFTGVEVLTELGLIFILNQSAPSIDLSNVSSDVNDIRINSNGSLTELIMPNTNINFLQVNFNPLLETLTFDNNVTTINTLNWEIGFNNSLTSLDLSMITANQPKPLAIQGNTLLNCVNLSNGGCVYWSSVMLNNNPSLYNVVVDNPSYSTIATNWFWTNHVVDPTSYQYITGSCPSADLMENHVKNSKNLVKVTDFMGRKVEANRNTPLIYYYSDGSIERVYQIEE